MAFFSVIIPVYNREGFLDRTVESVLNQDFIDFELIIVDDCSSDSSFSVIERLANTDRRIKTHKFSQNQGRCAARNKGLELAEGKWICYLDSDDEYYKNHLSIMSTLIEEFPHQLAFATDQHVNSKLKVYNNKRFKLETVQLLTIDFIESNPLTANQVCHSNSLEISWSDIRIPISEDWLFMRELSLLTPVLKKGIVTSNLNDHSGRSVNTVEVDKFVLYNLMGADLFVSRNQLDFNIVNRVRSYTNLLCINVYLNNKETRKAFGLLVKTLSYKRTYTYKLFYKAIIKLLLPKQFLNLK